MVDLDKRTDANNAWRRNRENWTHGREMRKGDVYTLWFDKKRMVSKIVLHSEGDRYPEKCRLDTFVGSSRIEGEEREWSNEKFEVCFPKPVIIDRFEVTIIEPRMLPLGRSGDSPAWSIYNIDVEEMRLFGRWWRRRIS